MVDSLTDIVGLQTSGIFAVGHEPSIRTLRQWTKLRKIPYYRLGHFIYFDPHEVAAHIRTRLRVPPRGEERTAQNVTSPTFPPSAISPEGVEADQPLLGSPSPRDRLPADVRFRNPREPRFEISKFRNRSGSIAFRVSGQLRGTRVRRNFKTRHEAHAEVEALKVSALQANAELHTAVTRLTEAQLREAESSYELLKARPRSLQFYLHYALQNFREPHEGKMLAPAAAEYLAARRHEHAQKLISTLYLRNTMYGLEKLLQQFPDYTVAELTGPRLLGFLERRHPSAKSFNNRRGILSAFLKFCRQHGWLEGDPLTQIPPRRVRRERGAAQTFSAAQTREFMTALESIADGRLVPYYALAFFAGIRPGVPYGEMARLTADVINLDERVIRISAAISKIHEPREITIQPNLLAWLRAYPLNRFPIVAGNFQQRRERFAKKFQLTHDVMRHTFISMLVAKFRSVGEAALQSGNSESIIRRHYLNLKSAAEAEEYFNILPTRAASSA